MVVEKEYPPKYKSLDDLLGNPEFVKKNSLVIYGYGDHLVNQGVITLLPNKSTYVLLIRICVKILVYQGFYGNSDPSRAYAVSLTSIIA